uniref:CULLIN_2 domain-containing protein n=1 Tax=Steinernema glaseri TaxID=37863 RepID=A0A1I8ARI6_9BILA
MSDYKDYQERDGGPAEGIDMCVRVLTQVHWPTQIAPMCQLSPPVAEAFHQFEKFYLAKHSGRKLTLNLGLGHADVRAVFIGGNKILRVNTYQMVILMRFNERTRFTFQELLDDTRIPERELKRALASMAMGKTSQRVLCRTVGHGKNIEAKDKFSVNEGFTSKQARIRIQMVSGRSETEPERKETRRKVDDDRKHEIEAAIVRVMKARKKLLHNQLITEVTDQLKARFLPDPVLIKKRI